LLTESHNLIVYKYVLKEFRFTMMSYCQITCLDNNKFKRYDYQNLIM